MVYRQTINFLGGWVALYLEPCILYLTGLVEDT